MKIPDFLIEMSKQMQTENVRCTSEPIWMVCYDKWLTCADNRGDKTIALLCDEDHHIECDDSDYTEIFDYLKQNHEDWCMRFIHDFDEEEEDIDELSSYLDPDDVCDSDMPENVTIEKLDMQKERPIVQAC